MRKNIKNNDISTSDAIIYIWDQKIKIFLITSIFVVLSLIYLSLTPKKFKLITQIKPISEFEVRDYSLFNGLVGDDATLITQESLLINFVNKVKEEKIIQEGIIKFKIINKEDYSDLELYNFTIKKTATTISDMMLPPLKTDQGKVLRQFWQIEYESEDVEKWNNFLNFLQDKVNEEIRMSLLENFNKEVKIIGLKEKFVLEDLNNQILNSKENHRVKITNRLAFLKEQAAISRTLGIESNTLEAQVFKKQDTTITNVSSLQEQRDNYYLKGYKVIEKEIELIISRKNKEAFISDLPELLREKNLLLSNKKIKRIKSLFESTPVLNIDKFYAARINVEGTTLMEFNSSKKIMILSIISGLIFSFFYLFTLNSIQNRR